MAHFSLRRAAASMLVFSVIAAVPASGATSRSVNGRDHRTAAERREAKRPWLLDLTLGMFEKLGVGIDPDGHRIDRQVPPVDPPNGHS